MIRDLETGRPNQTIALAMIVRNESAVIERCLTSVLPLIDSWVICDTGSTDGTPDLIRSTLDGLPGKLHERPWVDFGHNRTELMELARGAADFLLLVDADMTVVQRAPLRELTADAYLLRESGPLDSAVVRLVRGDSDWRYEGATHEYIAAEGQYRIEELDELLIEHHAEVPARRDKLLRDVALLKRDLARPEAMRRALFYLGQTFRDLGRPDLAADYYRQRVEAGGSSEEVFYANFQEGVLRLESDFEAAVAILLEAWEKRPTRAEPLFELARAYRLREYPAVAHMFASRGLRIEYPDDVLLVHRHVYEWGLRLERALAASDLGRLEEARADLLALLREADLSRPTERFVSRTLANLREPVPGRPVRTGPGEHPRLDVLAPSTRIAEIEVEVRPEWPSFNPSIARDGDGYRMTIRTCNYDIERGAMHADGVIHTVNYLASLDAALAITTLSPIVDRATARRYTHRVRGFEDLRLFEFHGQWYAVATTYELNPAVRRQIALLSLEGADIVDAKALPSPQPGRHEKNWMPFVVEGELCFVYTCSPTIILACDVQTGQARVVSERPGPAVAQEFRGGSQGIWLGRGGWLFVVHEVDMTSSVLQYLHRFVRLDEDFGVAAVSPPFTFADQRTEFCAGMALNRERDQLVLTFGVGDAAAGMVVLPISEALDLLEPCAPDSTTTVAGVRTG